jgi:hypothetical protein
MKKEFIMRGKTASGSTEVLNFSGYKEGYAYRLIEFKLYPSTNIGGETTELVGSVTAGKTAVAPTDPDFNNEGLIGVASATHYSSPAYPPSSRSVINDLFLITQNLILMVQDTDASGSQYPVNWQCRFVMEKMNGPEEAANNYKQYLISDGS